MEFWIIMDDGQMLLPVNPESYEIATGNNNESFTVQDIGEVSFIGKSKLSTISISSFFPAQDYDFAKFQFGFLISPNEMVNAVELYRTSGKPIRLLITNTRVNDLFTIEDFSFGEKDGTGDIYFSISLRQYKIINAPSAQIFNSPNSINIMDGNKVINNTRPVNKKIPNQYTVIEGEDIFDVALSWTGDMSNWRNIAQKNKLKSMDLVSGQVLYL